MAETVYKKISELTSASIPLAGTEYIEVSATGASKKALFSGIFGVGWWAKLMASFSAFKAPDADHADDADTLEGESASDLHDATALVGAVPLANIPAELTGKNASTVGGYSVGVGAGKINLIHGYLSGTYTEAQIFTALSSIIPNTSDAVGVSGGSVSGTVLNPLIWVFSKAVREGPSIIRIYGSYVTVGTSDMGVSSVRIDSVGSDSNIISLTY